MANVLVNDLYLSDIADAIREKLDTEDTYKPSEMANAIESIGGGVTPTGTKEITSNGTGIDVAQYAYADVAVPNSYSAGDEGKVVSNGALVSQSSDTVTANDTYDTTLINSLTVNVSGGGGGGAFPLIDTITIGSDTRTYNLDLTPYSSYNMVLIVFDTVTLSASDYLYFVRNGTEPTGGVYTAQKESFSGLAMIWGTWISPNKRMNVIGGSTTLQTNDTALTNIFIYCYSASKTIQAGSTIKIYGG